MRKIKFRAFDKRSNTIREVAEIKIDGKHYNARLIFPEPGATRNWHLRLFEEIELMQFTGLHDKNGSEIYEGDIIDDGIYCDIIVGWCNQLASFVLNRKGWAWQHWFGESCDPSKVEVVGNIYECT